MKNIQKIRIVISFFILSLVLSGLTAFPLKTEVEFISQHIQFFPEILHPWLQQVYKTVNSADPILLYGTDWLAFAHIVIALFFIGVYMDPVKNKFNIIVGMIACVGIMPILFICGPIRGIPLLHQLIDACFGVIGIIPLWYCYKKVLELELDFNLKK